MQGEAGSAVPMRFRRHKKILQTLRMNKISIFHKDKKMN